MIHLQAKWPMFSNAARNARNDASSTAKISNQLVPRFLLVFHLVRLYANWRALDQLNEHQTDLGFLIPYTMTLLNPVKT